MCETTKSIQEELHEMNCRLQKVEEYIRRQNMVDPFLFPKMFTPDTEGDFYTTFSREHPRFISCLRELLPTITPGEERLCMMVKLNMTVREIARMLNIDVKSVHTSRARLKRKLLILTNETAMDDWIKNI
ncbi:sigma-70 family RNA polymerase sigma factor [Bacteroides sp. 51]|uniref:helix-turn-helix transcriptional regulator n=1 Tax=Bacteroides sp. 51 TaxID=2302938 RepID=UPI0013D5E2D0|nr:sigma-70 family RNA polymerase sigma factor [Bacteroides sp. 51]NDV83801.1 sigma-70 family RNA polymerase sigma factor [Bacteroides sp. 51]